MLLAQIATQLADRVDLTPDDRDDPVAAYLRATLMTVTCDGDVISFVGGRC